MAAALVLVYGASPTVLGSASPSVEGWDISLEMVKIWWRLHVTRDFVCSCARRPRRHRKLVEVVPCVDKIHLLVTAMKSVVSFPRNWRRCFTFRQKVIQFVWTKKHFHTVKALILINLTNLSVSITGFTVGTILIIIFYCIDLLFVPLRSEFRLGIPLSYYVNIRNLGNSNICSFL